MGLTITGVGAFESALTSINTGDAAQQSIEEAAQELQSAIQDRAPVDTGHLRNSYGYTTTSEGNRAIAYVGTNVHYAEYQEFGTSIMAAQPHVRPALDATRDSLMETMAQGTLDRALNR